MDRVSICIWLSMLMESIASLNNVFGCGGFPIMICTNRFSGSQPGRVAIVTIRISSISTIKTTYKGVSPPWKQLA